jgi:hypothetical protein
MRVIKRVEWIAGQDVPFTEVEKHLAEEYIIMAERMTCIANRARESVNGPNHLMKSRLQAIENLANSAFYRDWDR